METPHRKVHSFFANEVEAVAGIQEEAGPVVKDRISEGQMLVRSDTV